MIEQTLSPTRLIFQNPQA